MIFHFEFRDRSHDEVKKFEITSDPDTEWLFLEAIESPCNDRSVIAIGGTVAELVDWTLQKFSKTDKKRYECYVDSEGYERCSHCNEHETGMRYFKFCPRCGVKLKGVNINE